MILDKINSMDEMNLKKTRRITTILFFTWYLIMMIIAVGMGHLDGKEYNKAWLSFNPEVLADYYSNMKASGEFFYYWFAHILDLLFAPIYTLLLLSITELAKRNYSTRPKVKKIAGIIKTMTIIVFFADWFETIMLQISVITNPLIPSFVMYAHIFGKGITSVLIIPLLIWLFFLLVMYIRRRIGR